MKDIIQFTQSVLDDALCQQGIETASDYNNAEFNTSAYSKFRGADEPLRSYWLLWQDLTEDDRPDEYIVYSVNEHEPEAGADGFGLIYVSYITVRYFCRDSWLGDSDKYQTIQKRLEQIRKALLDAEYDVSSGWRDVGDVDGISFETFVLQAEYTEVDRGDC